ncbi:MAG TPA: heme o synthase [Ktedonobacterales bacterium]|jgi:protoheme IX farnesyltransferase|nr:heme o synthase [Ktedonobacterales bacterium]
MQKATASSSTRSSTLSAYISLMKPHVTVLLLGTTLAAMAVAAQGMPALGLMLATLAGGAMAAGSANAINCWYDRDIDQLMSRTRLRALPAQRVPETHALVFGLVLGVGSFVVFTLFVNMLSAVLALAAILFYVGIYTMWLKRTTPQNIVIGGAAGAVPVLIGWSAVTNSIGLAAIWMFLIIFLWTPPHFWALSLVLKKDYERAHVPMLPVVMGERETYRQIILYTLLLFAATLVLFTTQAVGYFYLVSAVLLGIGLLVLGVQLAREQTLASARRVFWFSNYYLALLFAAMVVDRVLR